MTRLGWRVGLIVVAALSPFALVSAASCGSDNASSSSSGQGAAAGTAGNGATGGAGGTSGTYSSGNGPAPVNQAPCGAKLYQCGDLADNDDDGWIDYQDQDCLGPCDNNESGYYTDLPGMSGGPCKLDCFWDNGNGSGTDDCFWDHKCDPLEVGPNYPPEGADCAYDPNASAGPYTCDEAFTSQSQTCLDVCTPLTPNGCDCFGCCELPAGSGAFVWLASADYDTKVGTCSIDVVDDPDKCHPCTPVPGCNNDCQPCELCLGKTELPPECFEPDGGTPMGQCPPELTACGLEGQAPCPPNYFCLTGCCVTAVN